LGRVNAGSWWRSTERGILLGHQYWLGIPGQWESNSPHDVTLPEWLRHARGVVVLRVTSCTGWVLIGPGRWVGRDIKPFCDCLPAPTSMPDISSHMKGEANREWLEHVAGRLGVEPESLERLAKRPHVEYGDRFTEGQLKPLYDNLKSYEPADCRREVAERLERCERDSRVDDEESALEAPLHGRGRVAASAHSDGQRSHPDRDAGTGPQAEIIAARTKRELVTQRCVSSRAADIYRLGLFVVRTAPLAVSQVGDDDPLVDMTFSCRSVSPTGRGGRTKGPKAGGWPTRCSPDRRGRRGGGRRRVRVGRSRGLRPPPGTVRTRLAPGIRQADGAFAAGRASEAAARRSA
jgi:hypothetical protein